MRLKPSPGIFFVASIPSLLPLAISLVAWSGTSDGPLGGESWDQWAERHGDWGRDGVRYVAVRHGGLRLAEVVRAVGMKDQAGVQGVKRFGEALADDPERTRFVSKLKRELSLI